MTNDNEDTNFQTTWDTANVVLTEEHIVIQAHIKKQETQRNNIISHLKKLEKRKTESPKIGEARK